VRHVGEPIAMVIAETPALARDGVERVVVDYDPLPAVVGALDAVAPAAPIVWDEAASNLCVDSLAGDATAAEAAIAGAAHVVSFQTRVNRVTGVPMEPRTAVGDWTGERPLHRVLRLGGSWRLRGEIAVVLACRRARCAWWRATWAAAGTRNSSYRARAGGLGRPSRRATGEVDGHASGDVPDRLPESRSRLARRAGPRRAGTSWPSGDNASNIGAPPCRSFRWPGRRRVHQRVPRAGGGDARARDAEPHATDHALALAGRVMFVIERTIDLAARRHGFDRVALRRRNLVPATAMPYRNPLGLLYDSGDYAAAQDRVVALADWAGFEARRAEARKRGRYRGIGLGNYIELNTGMPRERTEITVHPEGRVDVVLGTLSAGQGH
jgi:carbon-monoxide dehydrogenase large subunit